MKFDLAGAAYEQGGLTISILYTGLKKSNKIILIHQALSEGVRAISGMSLSPLDTSSDSILTISELTCICIVRSFKFVFPFVILTFIII